jgi:hypothetical protein
MKELQNEWVDGKLADTPAGHGPETHVTAGIQETYSLNVEEAEDLLPTPKRAERSGNESR